MKEEHDTPTWKCGNEFAPYHRSASHVNPDHRDGWNACFKAAEEALAQQKREAIVLWEENALCREAIEACLLLVDAFQDENEDDGSQGAARATKRRLNEAIGKAVPRLMMERQEGQKFYGLHWREMRERAEAAEARLQQAMDVVRELVACKDLKETMVTLRSDPYYTTQADWTEIEYERRKPAAWAAARAFLEEHDEEPQR